MRNLRLCCKLVFGMAFAGASISGFAASVWTIEPPGSSFQFVKAGEGAGRVELEFRNVSDKIISAYIVCLNGEDGASCDLRDWSVGQAKEGMKPGDTETVHVPAAMAAKADNTLHIAAVVFDDGSAEGNSEALLRIRLNRLGRALETMRLEFLLSALKGTALGDRDIDKAIAVIGRKAVGWEDPSFIGELKRYAELRGLRMPELSALPQWLRAGFVHSAQMERALVADSLGKIRDKNPSSARTHAPERKMRVSELKDALRTRGSKLTEVCKKLQQGRS